MTKHIPWLTILIMFCLIVGINEARGHDRSGPTNPTTPTQSTPHKSSKSFNVPVLLIIGGIACIIWCGDEAPKEPPPNPGPAVKNDVTPDPPKPDQFYMLEVR
jgi:hypothetical protein